MAQIIVRKLEEEVVRRLREEAAREGVSAEDGLIAATASVHELDARHAQRKGCAGLGVPVLNPGRV